ncbi:helix-turn-helix transcriptional regulator [Rhizobium sp. NRK18]|uniref:helix-turn-helix transcriptional regulator n=1 Tax=Rhizobium sp. NRK18 TaxID=2964667 RepID=UPI0021C30D51|nr:AraC family transcriptional regulator [Rhizobium sp. NRK18]MCQ2004822.1 AraC family transcriptional regulator [Rhizobium sp. NRK18]
MGDFHRLAFAEADPGDMGRLLDVLEPSISFFMDRHEDERMAMDFSLRIMPDAYTSSQFLSGVAARRQKTHAIRDGNDDLCLLVPRGGLPIHLRLSDRHHGADEVVLHAGGPAHLRGNEESYHAWSLGSDSQVVCVPRSKVAASIDDLDQVLHRGVPQSAALNLLCGYAKTLASDIGPLDTGMLLHAGKTLTDLFILALGPTRDAAEAAEGSARAARLAGVKADIDAHLAHPEFSLDWISRRQGLSPRAIRDLFYGAGTNFTDHVLAARLERARRLLGDPDLVHRNITSIAYDCGFGDLSWFNQAFRRRYGMTPSELRRSEQETYSV